MAEHENEPNGRKYPTIREQVKMTRSEALLTMGAVAASVSFLQRAVADLNMSNLWTRQVSDKLLEEEITDRNLLAVVKRLKKEMFKASRELDFERAARIRDKIKELNGEKEIELHQRRR